MAIPTDIKSRIINDPSSISEIQKQDITDELIEFTMQQPDFNFSKIYGNLDVLFRNLNFANKYIQYAIETGTVEFSTAELIKNHFLNNLSLFMDKYSDIVNLGVQFSEEDRQKILEYARTENFSFRMANPDFLRNDLDVNLNVVMHSTCLTDLADINFWLDYNIEQIQRMAKKISTFPITKLGKEEKNVIENTIYGNLTLVDSIVSENLYFSDLLNRCKYIPYMIPKNIEYGEYYPSVDSDERIFVYSSRFTIETLRRDFSNVINYPGLLDSRFRFSDSEQREVYMIAKENNYIVTKTSPYIFTENPYLTDYVNARKNNKFAEVMKKLENDFSLIKDIKTDFLAFTDEEQRRIYELYKDRETEFKDDNIIKAQMMRNKYYMMQFLEKNIDQIDELSFDGLGFPDEFVQKIADMLLETGYVASENTPMFLRNNTYFVYNYIKQNNGELAGLSLIDVAKVLRFSEIKKHPEYRELSHFYEQLKLPYTDYFNFWGIDKTLDYAEKIGDLVRFLTPGENYNVEDFEDYFK